MSHLRFLRKVHGLNFSSLASPRALGQLVTPSIPAPDLSQIAYKKAAASHHRNMRATVKYLISVLAIVFSPTNAFTPLTSTCIKTRSCNHKNGYSPSLLCATSGNEEQKTDITTNYESDPRQALQQFGSLFTQVQSILLEGSSWDNETLELKTQEFVRTYLQIFIPGISYAFTSFTVLSSTFLLILLGLTVGGRGYNDILTMLASIEPLRAFLEKADPTWGNAAIASLGCEVLSPVILGATLALTPRTMEALRRKLEELGWGEDDINERAADILRLTG